MKILPFSKTYEKRTVLDFPGRSLEPGRIYAVIGANGSGKSTFAKILSGILPADKKGKHVSGGSIGYMPQKNYAYRMSTRANILLNGKDAARAERLMDAIQLRHLENKRADKLSGGETARMALVRLMMKQYDLVLLDEPTAAMDMETTLLSENLISQYVRETNCSLILVTHSLQQARRVADEVWYFHKGKLLEAGTKEQVLTTPKKAETKQFLEFYGV
jgi:ABC-type multidrug transport system ATPase subunit